MLALKISSLNKNDSQMKRSLRSVKPSLPQGHLFISQGRWTGREHKKWLTKLGGGDTTGL